jgi:hypothetical protein
MNHILLDCPNSLPCKIIQNFAKIIREMKGEKWEKITYGKIMGTHIELNSTNLHLFKTLQYLCQDMPQDFTATNIVHFPQLLKRGETWTVCPLCDHNL